MKRAFFTLISVIVLLAVIEFASRLMLSKIYNRKFDSSLIVDNKYFTSSGLKENATGIVWGKPLHTDGFGCRKSPVAYAPKKKKWLFIGDSVTEGVGVDDSSTFAAILARRIDSFNVMNYSLIGYSVSDYLNVLKALLATHDSSIRRATIFFCVNDVYGPVKANQLPRMAKPNLIGKVNDLLQNKIATYKLVKLLVYQYSNRYFIYDKQFYKANSPYFIEAMHRLKDCDSVCVAAGIKMNVVMFSYRSQWDVNGWKNDDPQMMVNDFCYHNDIPFDALQAPPPVLSHKMYLFGDEIHFSKYGHKIIAGVLAYYILSH